MKDVRSGRSTNLFIDRPIAMNELKTNYSSMIVLNFLNKIICTQILQRATGRLITSRFIDDLKKKKKNRSGWAINCQLHFVNLRNNQNALHSCYQ